MATFLRASSLVLTLAWLLGHAQIARAQQPKGGEAKLGVEIDSLPYVIDAPGVYVLKQDFLNLNLAGGAAIIVNSDDAVIDLNGHAISNAGAGTGTMAFGIYALDRSNLVVRNGTLKGFLCAVFLDAGAPSGGNRLASGAHLIEKVLAEGNRCWGVNLNADNSMVRGCRIENTGGSSASGYNTPVGISASGSGNRVLDCDIDALTAAGCGILFAAAPDGFAVDNRIGGPAAIGIFSASGSTLNQRNNLVGANVTMDYLDSGVSSADYNGNNINDAWENYYFGNLSHSDPEEDFDGDGLSNLQEYQLGTNPTVASTAGDAFTDGWKVKHTLNPHRKIVADNAAGTILGLQVFTPLN